MGLGVTRIPEQEERTVNERLHIVEGDITKQAVDAIVKSAKTGKIGDGKVFVLPIEDAIRIRTEERGEAAV